MYSNISYISKCYIVCYIGKIYIYFLIKKVSTFRGSFSPVEVWITWGTEFCPDPTLELFMAVLDTDVFGLYPGFWNYSGKAEVNTPETYKQERISSKPTQEV